MIEPFPLHARSRVAANDLLVVRELPGGAVRQEGGEQDSEKMEATPTGYAAAAAVLPSP